MREVHGQRRHGEIRRNPHVQAQQERQNPSVKNFANRDSHRDIGQIRFNIDDLGDEEITKVLRAQGGVVIIDTATGTVTAEEKENGKAKHIMLNVKRSPASPT